MDADEKYKALADFAEENAIQIAALTALIKALAMTLSSAQREEARRLLVLASGSTEGPKKAKLKQELKRIGDLLL